MKLIAWENQFCCHRTMSEPRPREAFSRPIRAMIVGFALHAGMAHGTDFSGAALKRITTGSTIVGIKARRSGDTWCKYQVFLLIDEALRVQRARDPSIDLTAPLTRWPHFDSRKLGYEEIVFAGSDPSGISDPGLKAAYYQALKDHFMVLEKHVRELRKQEAVHHCLKTAHDVLQLIKHPVTRIGVLQNVNALECDPALKEIVQFGRMPSPPASRQALLSVQTAPTADINQKPLIVSILLLAGLSAWLVRRHFRAFPATTV